MSQSIVPDPVSTGGQDFWTPVARSPGIVVASAVAAANYTFEGFNAGLTTSPAANLIDSEAFSILAADMAVTGKTANLKTRLTVLSNTVAPVLTFTGGLSKITASAGGSSALSVTFGAQTAGTTVAIASPSASAVTGPTDSTAFTLPADGLYFLTVTTSATMTTNAKAVCYLELLLKHV